MPRESRFPIFITPLPNPSPNDPPGAENFYQALGIATVACGRPEGHFVACLAMIIQIANDKRVGDTLSTSWDDHYKIWKNAFTFIPALIPHAGRAFAIVDEIGDHTKVRNLIAHGLWNNFQPQMPLTMDIVKIKGVKPKSVEFCETSLSIVELNQIAERASKLNEKLLELSTILSRLVAWLYGSGSKKFMSHDNSKII